MSNALAYFNAPIRTLLLAAALAFAAQAADARSTAPGPAATVRGTARSETDAAPANADGVPIDGVVIVVGIVGVVILLAWVCSRVGDSR
jgi:hypothetical protein